MKLLFNTFVMSLGMLFAVYADGKTVEFIENGYAQQAHADIVALTEAAAAYFDFIPAYEVAIPKKAGLQVNPWNSFMNYGINPQTKNPYLVINSEWFSKFSAPEQQFLLGRAFEGFKQGTPWYITSSFYIFSLFSILMVFLTYWVLGFTRLREQKKWIRALIAYGIIAICNLAFMNTVHTRLVKYLGKRYDHHVIVSVIQKTENKQAAIKALDAFDASIKKDLAEGQLYWKPYENLFQEYSQSLKK